MRKAIRTRTRRRLRLALPAVAAAAAFALTGCGSEDGDAPFGAEGGALPGAEDDSGDSGDSGGGGGGSQTPSQEDQDDSSGGEETSGGEPPDFEDDSSGGSSGGSTGGGGGGSATLEQVVGDWYTGYEPEDSSLSIDNAGSVTYIENTLDEGDVCSGTATDGAITLADCTQFGTVLWSSMNASLEMSGSTLVVTWDDGTVQEYTTF